MAFVLPVSIGSLLWMYNKLDCWARSLIDEYSHAIANGKLRKEEALSTGAEAAGENADAARESVRECLPEREPQSSAIIQPTGFSPLGLPFKKRLYG